MFSTGELVNGRWEVMSTGGKGAFSRIYIARDKESAENNEHIIKTSSDSIDATVLRLERDVIRDLSGSERSPVFVDAGVYNGSDFIVMEYFTGESMATIRDRARRNFENHGFIPIPVAAYFTKEMLACLQLLHERGYVHRDVKPANFVRTSRTGTKFGIIDFGLTKKQSRGRKSVAEFRGTTSYCSPHVHNNQDQSFRDDLYSMMFTFFDLICGKLPWTNSVKAKDKAAVATLKTPCLQNPNYMIDWTRTCFSEFSEPNTSSPELSAACEEACVKIMKHLNELDYDDKPDYHLINTALDTLIGESKIENIDFSSNLFSWEGINVAPREREKSVALKVKKEFFNKCVETLWNARSEYIKSVISWVVTHNISISAPSTPADILSGDNKKYNFEIFGIDNRFNFMTNVAHHLRSLGKSVVTTRFEVMKGDAFGLCGNFPVVGGVLDQGLIWCNLFLLMFHNIPTNYWSREVVDLLDATLIEASYFMADFVTSNIVEIWTNIQQCVFEFIAIRDQLQKRSVEAFGARPPQSSSKRMRLNR